MYVYVAVVAVKMYWCYKSKNIKAATKKTRSVTKKMDIYLHMSNHHAHILHLHEVAVLQFALVSGCI